MIFLVENEEKNNIGSRISLKDIVKQIFRYQLLRILSHTIL